MNVLGALWPNQEMEISVATDNEPGIVPIIFSFLSLRQMHAVAPVCRLWKLSIEGAYLEWQSGAHWDVAWSSTSVNGHRGLGFEVVSECLQLCKLRDEDALPCTIISDVRSACLMRMVEVAITSGQAQAAASCGANDYKSAIDSITASLLRHVSAARNIVGFEQTMEAAISSLRVLIGLRKIEKETFRSGLRPLLLPIADHRKYCTDPHHFEALQRITSLFWNFFNSSLTEKLFEHLEFLPIYDKFLALAPQTRVAIVTALLSVFAECANLLDGQGERLIAAVRAVHRPLNRSMYMLCSDPIREQLLCTLQRMPGSHEHLSLMRSTF